jgi:hypothetical protein
MSKTQNTTTTTTVTAYGFAKVVNGILKEANPPLPELPAQMFYSYTKKGMLGTEEKPLTAEYAPVWAAEYIERKAARVQAKEAKVAAELAGETEAEETETANADAEA